TYNESLRPFIETREAFESRLKTMQGLEFVVAHDPLIEFGAALEAAKKEGPVKVQQQMSQEPSNIWVIRKQMRRKVPGKGDEIEALATYFVVGDSIYMAPSVYGVVGSRMVIISPGFGVPPLPQITPGFAD
ncbi:Mediator of RNA polymerase II transcription subunit 6, partial [Ascosphaera atra]